MIYETDVMGYVATVMKHTSEDSRSQLKNPNDLIEDLYGRLSVLELYSMEEMKTVVEPMLRTRINHLCDVASLPEQFLYAPRHESEQHRDSSN